MQALTACETTVDVSLTVTTRRRTDLARGPRRTGTADLAHPDRQRFPCCTKLLLILKSLAL
jgi:hypothetical protein